MKKFIIKNLQFTILITLFISLLFVGKVIAQEVSPEPSPSPDEMIKQKVEERIEKVLNTNDDKKQALVGTLKEVANATLTLDTQFGEAQVKVAEDATIVDADRKEIEIEDLEIGSKIICMGYLDSQNVLEAKRIAVREEFQTPTTEAIFGIVTDISQEEKVLTIKHPKDQGIYTIEMGTTVKITKNIEGETETIKFNDIEEDDRLVVIGEPGEDEEKMITAKLIHVVSLEIETMPAETPEAEEELESPLPTPETEEE